MSANTFGTGPRMCIGNRLALLTVKTAAVTVLRSYRFVTCDKTEVSWSSFLLYLMPGISPEVLRFEAGGSR